MALEQESGRLLQLEASAPPKCFGPNKKPFTIAKPTAVRPSALCEQKKSKKQSVVIGKWLTAATALA